jgi:hypothetical protein
MFCPPILRSRIAAPAADWADQTFGSVDLGDRRRTKRLVTLATAWATSPTKTMPQQSKAPAALKASYRLLHTDEVNVAQILAPHTEETRQLAATCPVVLLVQDTTAFDFTAHRQTSGLAPIGDGRGRGFHLQTVLALTPERMPVGVLAAEFWLRQPHPRDETRTERAQRVRESERWGRMVRRVGTPPAGCCWVHVADREADIYDFFLAVQETGSEVLVRLVQNRVVLDDEGSPGHLLDALRDHPVQGQRSLRIPGRPGRKARTAMVGVAWGRTTLQPPRRRDRRCPHPAPCPIWTVRVWELDPPAEVLPIEWMLATTVPVETEAEAWERVAWYTARWVIEEFHQALKSGCGGEVTQLRDCAAIWRRVAILLPLAVRLLVLRSLSRDDPELPVGLVADPLTVQLVARRTGLAAATTVGAFTRQVARLGGHQGRAGDGPPGWKSLWEGWWYVETLLEGIRLAHELDATQKCG